MSNFDIKAWYKGGVAAAVALLGVGAVAENKPLLIFAIGLMMLSIGEWINHPFGSRVIPGFIVSGEVRNNKIGGLAFAVIGIALMAYGLYGLVFS